ncbi:hypothetical protein KTO63_25245 [Parasegetibacter sp. MAH-26]|uniref:Uncharacterized protein n=1 Tax=Pinibacter aurantiacus TaxID=2851599 RepID=A0A9E2SFK9_9BACT|nr:hypothetical protein [Pinibacter aurantiacus]
MKYRLLVLTKFRLLNVKGFGKTSSSMQFYYARLIYWTQQSNNLRN